VAADDRLEVAKKSSGRRLLGCELIAAGMAEFTERALRLSPQPLYLGRALDWE
jgi:hypothetical protein